MVGETSSHCSMFRDVMGIRLAMLPVCCLTVRFLYSVFSTTQIVSPLRKTGVSMPIVATYMPLAVSVVE